MNELLGIAQVIVATATLLGVIFSFINSLRNSRKIDEAKAVATEAKTIALKTEINTNSMSAALVASTKIVAHAEGKAEGIEQEKANPSPTMGSL